METREEWLESAAALLAVQRFGSIGVTVPKTRVSVGFPKGARGGKATSIGQCWSPEVAGDKLHHVFVSPVVSDPVKAVATLAHELVHASVGLKAKHGAGFKRVAEGIGLTGKMTATVPSDGFASWVHGSVLAALGPYPQPTFEPDQMTTPKQGTRLIKAVCPDDGCTIRITKKWIDDIGVPVCACGTKMRVEP